MSSDGIDRGLAAGFGPRSGEDSVLDRLGLRAASVVLEPGTADAPEAQPLGDDVLAATFDEGRYQVSGEIARGGVGVILEGKDLELGRAVAVKVLRPELQEAPQILWRFVEEAQIGGQLQHPGIAPVYDLGLMADQRPYFAMKLVEGRTLADLLEERADVETDRRNLLQIYEQICQTVAYAHARGVIHRDLKPANVMVGAFGEVQVMDWGFAKVLARGGVADEPLPAPEETEIHTVRTDSGGSESQAGSVLGTPCYMPPEQAKGQLDRIDERSDVFALGAVLLEILTGAPPYPVARDTLIRAARADLDDALERLDAAPARTRLKDLCRACLAPDPSDRPRHAGEIAEAVGGHLAELEEEAQAKEREAAASRVRAAGERRARRLTVGIASALLLAIVLGGGGWLWAKSEREAERTKAHHVFTESLAEVDQLLGAATALTPVSLAEWSAQVEAWERVEGALGEAERLARAAGVDGGAGGPLAARFADLAAGLAAARVGADRAQRDQEMVERLEEIRRADFAFGIRLSMAAAFQDHGLDVLGGDLDEVAASVRDSAIRLQLVAGLEKWATEQGGYQKQPAEEGTRILDVLERADPDPIRQGIREAARRQDLVRLQELIAENDPRLYEENTPNRMAVHLQRLKAYADAQAFLEETVRRCRDSYWAHVQLGVAYLESEPKRPSEAVGYFRGALALRPDDVFARYAMGLAFDEVDRPEEALEALVDAFRRDPELVGLTNMHVVGRLRKAGRLQSVIEDLRLEVAERRDDAAAHFRLASALEAAGHRPKALEHFEQAYRLASDNAHYGLCFAVALMDAGHAKRARELYQKISRLNPRQPSFLSRFAHAILRQDEILEARKIFEEVVRLAPGAAGARFRIGCIHYRLGQVDEALAALQGAVDQWRGFFVGQFILGLVHARSGNLQEAVEVLEVARSVPAPGKTREQVYWHLGCSLLGLDRLEEARSILESYYERSSWTDERRYPADAWARDVDDYILLAREHLPPRPGEPLPDFGPERMYRYATLAYAHAYYETASRAYAAAFLVDPELPKAFGPWATQWRNLACAAYAAGHAAEGRGLDAHVLDEAGRQAWRDQAYEWLADDLALWKEALSRGEDNRVHRGLRILLNDVDAAPLREKALLARLPEPERNLWTALWDEIRDIHAQTGE